MFICFARATDRAISSRYASQQRFFYNGWSAFSARSSPSDPETTCAMISVPAREEFRPCVARSEVRGRQRISETARKKLQAEASNNGQFRAQRRNAVEAHASPPRADDPLVHRHNENGSFRMPSRIGKRRERSAPDLGPRAR